MADEPNRRWIHNSTPCMSQVDADAGYECEIVDASAYDRLQSIVQRVGILVATWVELEDDWVYASYESPEKEQGARDAIICAAEAVRNVFREYAPIAAPTTRSNETGETNTNDHHCRHDPLAENAQRDIHSRARCITSGRHNQRIL